MHLHPKTFVPSAIALLAFSILFITCRKHEGDGFVEVQADFTKMVNASVTGFVTNESDFPVTGAAVKYGVSSAITDKYGYFEIKNAAVMENAAFVSVIMNGYFKGIKTFTVENGKANFCRIKLIPKTNSGTITAASGGEVTLPNGLKIAVPANAIMNAVTKTSYTGTVNVSSFWINPTDKDIDKLMPGNLMGINENGSLKGLVTYGMAAVELTGNSGELLQIAEGKKASLSMPIPSTILAGAPATIPLWYFDESKGLWKEEGLATKSGNSYTGEVSHFSYWNCDLPNATIPVSFTITDSFDNPIGNVHVEITPLTTNSWSHIGGYTDETGYVHVPVTPNTQYKLQLFSNSCQGDIPFSKIFTVENKPVDLGKVSLGGGYATTINGTVTDCNNIPLVNGQIVLQNGNFYERFYSKGDGSFSHTTLLCNSTNQSIFFVENDAASQQGQPVTYTLHTGSNQVGNLQACGVSMEEYSNLVINGQSYILGAYPNGTFASTGSLDAAARTHFNITLLKLKNGVYVKNGDHIQWGSDHSQSPPDLNGTNSIAYFNLYRGFDDGNINVDNLVPARLRPLQVHFTEYGPAGGYISGSINGNLYKDVYPILDTLNPYHVSYSFRVKRY